MDIEEYDETGLLDDYLINLLIKNVTRETPLNKTEIKVRF